jgi:hypothetical protein
MNSTKKVRHNRREARSPYMRQRHASPRPPLPHELRTSTPDLSTSGSGSRDQSLLTELEDDDADEEPTPRPLLPQNQIPKPPGEAGRTNCGGFNLENSLHWEGNKYRRMMVSNMSLSGTNNSSSIQNYVNDMIKDRLDANQCFSNQDQNILAELIQTVCTLTKWH